ncbi:MAG: ABC transporter ATP-binding protein [Candidatus Caldipriscus sp.]|jgi:ABC-type sugar transport system ATPase subunit
MEIRLENVSKVFQGFIALKNINLTISSGEFVVMLGPSGCGKTTLLRIISGLEKPTTGRVYFGGKDVTDLPPSKREIGMVFQNYALYPHMTVFENLAFPLRMAGVDSKRIKVEVEEIAKKLRLYEHLNKKPRQLSGGQRQRVALGRALIKKPKVFLFDEPLSNLDANLRMDMRVEIGRLHREIKTTTIYVTHDQVEAMSLADKIVVMNKGEIVQVGTPIEIYENPKDTFVATFIGSPPMNLIFGEFSEGVFFSDGIKISGNFPYKGKGYMGFRPEGAEITSNGILRGRVEHREIFGEESIVYVSVDNKTISVRHFGFPPRVGENVGINLKKIYVFNEEGNSIYPPSSRTIP